MRFEEGRLLGDWRLIKEIGYGAIGRSIVAEHRFTKQKVVLKVLPEDLASDRAFVLRFEEETMVLSSLDHPNIAKVYTVSLIDGVYLLVVECIVDAKKETMTVQKLVRETELTHRQIFHIAEQIASALDYAHTVKTIGGTSRITSFSHGAMKPSNILIATPEEPSDSSTIRVKLSDFGLTRIVGQATWLMRSYAAMIERLFADETKPGAQQGHRAQSAKGASGSVDEVLSRIAQTLMFLSPEQRQGNWATPHESDVWAFGVLLYWLLAKGKYPEGAWDAPEFQTTLEASALLEVARQCLSRDPEKRPKILTPIIQGVTQETKGPMIPFRQGERVHESDAVLGTDTMGAMGVRITGSHCEPAASKQAEKVIKEYVPEKREPRHVEPLLTEMISIAGGTYFRGSNQACRDESPRHQIRLTSFRIDIHPVTNEQFVRFIEFVGDEKDKQNHDMIRLRDSRINRSSGKCTIERGYAKHPVVGVTWYGARAYAAWIGKRLPTEAEWEIACYGGFENALYPTGEGIERQQANFFYSDTTPVMSYPPNGYELYDLAGNVYEWCQDWYEYNYYHFSAMEPDNPKGPIQGVYRVLRGGCWKSLKEDLRCAKRHRNNPGAANGTYGFRCASDVEPSDAGDAGSTR